MNLTTLSKTTTKTSKRIGRGHGSGRGGHTSTRGHKGQKARGTIALFFEGSKMKKTLLKRLPLIRGKGKFKPQADNFVIVNLADLAVFKKDEEVNVSTLKAKGVLPRSFDETVGVKVLGTGELAAALTVALPVSKSAKEKIEKAGGKVLESTKE
ncbi:MAG: 50S ribosomal protein L15 [Patescibacteria group bacterium]|jgi:large subunit ribosomal protein L15